MLEEKGLPEQKTQTGIQAKPAIPAEIKLLADIVVQLNILKKNLAIYPEGHLLITQSTSAALEALQKSFQISPVVTIGAAKEYLYLGGRRIETKNPVFRDFAATLNRLGITSLFISQGLQAEELLRLQRILGMRPEDVRARGDIASVAAAAGLEHVRIRLLDYSMFRPTDEAEIKGPSASPPPTG